MLGPREFAEVCVDDARGHDSVGAVGPQAVSLDALVDAARDKRGAAGGSIKEEL